MSAPIEGRVLAPDEVTVEEAATYVREAMGSAVEAVVEVGRRLREMKEKVGHGNWLPLVDRLPISERTARRFIQIASHPDLQIGHSVSDLPPSYGTLSVLAALPPGGIARLVADGSVTPETTRAEAQALVAQINAAHQEALNEWSAAVDGLTAALSYFAGGFVPPADIPDSYVPVSEFWERFDLIAKYREP